jgi:hypothetical protein
MEHELTKGEIAELRKKHIWYAILVMTSILITS